LVLRQDTVKKKVVLLGVFNRTNYSVDHYAQAMEKSLKTRLNNSGRLLLTPSDNFNSIGSNPGHGSVLIPKAQELGLNAFIKGDISELEIRHKIKGIYGFRKEEPVLSIMVSLEMVDVETGTMLYQGQRKVGMNVSMEKESTVKDYLEHHKSLPDSLINDALKDLSRDIIDVMSDQPWKGFITAIRGNRIEFNAGKDIGLKPGMELNIWSTGHKMSNYAGQVFRMPGNIKGTASCEKVGESTTIAVVTKGKDIKIGNTLTLH